MSWVASFAARAGVCVLVGLSIYIGFQYWLARDQEQLAWITVAAEMIAFAGLAVARAGWRTHWGWAAIAILLTILAAFWCGLTMFEKIRDDSRARAVAQAQLTLPYTTARDDLNVATRALRAALAAPRPEGQGPLTIAAWDAAQGAQVERLEAARDNALARMETALPAIAFDWIAVARGLGVELIKLLGFAAFGLSLSQQRETSKKGVRVWRWPWIVAATSVASAPAFAVEAPVNTVISGLLEPEAIVRLPETSKKAQAFAMRGRFPAPVIAEKIGMSQATVYRWFRERDLETGVKKPKIA